MRLVIKLLLVGALALAPASVQSSSYLEHIGHFLPTANLAINKIKQAWSPAHQLQSELPVADKFEQLGDLSTTANSSAITDSSKLAQPLQTTATPTASTPSSSSLLTSSLPLSEAATPGTPSATSSAGQPTTSDLPVATSTADLPSKNEFVRIVTEAELQTSAAGAPSNGLQGLDEPASSQAPEPESPAASEQPDLSPAPGANPSPSQQQQQPTSLAPGSVESSSKASAEEASREAELEAVAAVDASIGFNSDPFAALADSCYDEYGNARYCEPDFENVAFERQLEVSSECGQTPSRFCTAYLNERNDQIRNCHICDSQHPKKRHPAAYLTDLNSASSPTCWVSAPIGVPTNESAPSRLDNVTLVLNLDKKYEITYVSMQFCTIKPDSLAIYRSSDSGRTWSPYQFYSSQCKRVYGRQSRATAKSSELEASCTNSSGLPGSARLAFSTLDGRNKASQTAERSAALQDWLTATNIKIVLDRYQTSGLTSAALGGHAHHHSGPNESTEASSPASPTGRNSSTESVAGQQPLENSLINPSDTYNYAMSDLTVGGRCKCNGHASRCVHGRDGRLHCECRHNTAGRDCERCAPFHFDRPWARASQLDASPCQPCNCNGHSRKCRFDPELYRLSGRRSGGVCLGCRDNTAGRHCHYCREGFTRDHSKPMSHKEACKHCDCHPIGSQGKVCNQTSGQCPCKEGVTGLQCNRCAPGYQQSSSLTEPCIKLPENDINYEPSLTVDGTDESGPSQPATAEPTAARAPSTGRAHQASPDKDQELSQPDQALDKPSDDEPGELAEEPERRPASGARGRQRAHSQSPWRAKQYAGFSAAPSRKVATAQQFALDELQPDDDELDDTDEPRPIRRPMLTDDYSNMAGVAGARVYIQPSYATYGKSRLVPEYRGRGRQMHSSRNRANEILVQPMASLDPGADESLDETNSYALYNDDTFNQIQTGPVRRLQSSSGRARARARYEPNGLESPACGECQPSTRRLSFRQFCHLDYAIKATIHNKEVADDWTRFEVEIQDVFKSVGSNSLLAVRGANYIDQTGDQTQANATEPLHRIKVGQLQSVLVPTEDLSCKCPKLRQRSTYLLMGSTLENNSKDNSDRSLQLDRHGIALEWKSSLQEKLIKYQRRLARGRC